jgi:hypothetical protein
MAETKPTNTVDWVATGAITEPLAGVKTSGYASGNKLPAKYMNWFWELSTQWLKWFNERFFDGASANALTVKCPAAGAGALKLEGGSSPTGTDQDGGDAEISGGSTTGNKGTTAALKAATAAASGTGVNTPEAYLTADGDNEQNTFAKPLTSSIASESGAGTDALTTTGGATSGVAAAGDGVVATGGAAASGDAGHGVVATGGVGTNAGDGVIATGGAGGSTSKGLGIVATGGTVGAFASAGPTGASIAGGVGGTSGAGYNGGEGAFITGGAGSGSGVYGDGATIRGTNAINADVLTAGGKCLKCDRGAGTGVDINLKPYSGAPSSPVEGDVWFDSGASAGQKLKIYMDGATKYINVT